MFELRVEVEFPAAHHLTGYPGDCARPHGHNWVVEVFAQSRGLDEVGLAMDFRLLKGWVKELVAPWDHQDLNELGDFKRVNPSAEQIAKICYDRLTERMRLGGRAFVDARISRVTVWENPRCSATYWDPDTTDRWLRGGN